MATPAPKLCPCGVALPENYPHTDCAHCRDCKQEAIRREQQIPWEEPHETHRQGRRLPIDLSFYESR